MESRIVEEQRNEIKTTKRNALGPIATSLGPPFDVVVKNAPQKNWLCLSDEIRSYFQSEYA